MLPDNPHGQPVDPATLPPVRTAMPVPPLQQPLPSGTVPVPALAAPAGTVQVTAQAKQLVEQYQSNPYQLSRALQELKTRYLAEQFHINIGPSQK